MNTSYSVFIKKETTSYEIKSSLEKVLNCPLVIDRSLDWECYRAVLFGLEVSLLVGFDYVDDRDLKLSQYNFEIMVDYIGNAFNTSYIDDWRRMASLIIGNMLSNQLKCETIVVKNVQTLIERFMPNTGG